MVGNCDFLKRLRNVHLEKSVATGICRVQRSPKTAKTPRKVHLRLRFQNPGKPRTAGLCGRAVGACDCGPLSVLKSNGFHHSENLPVKFVFSSKTVPANIAKKLPLQLRPKPLFIAFFSLSHKRPTFAFTGKNGYTLGFQRRIAHSGLHGETGSVSGGGRYLHPRSVPRVLKTLRGQGLKRQTLPLLGLGRGCSQRTQRAFGTAMRLCASLLRGVADPLGCVIQ